MADRPIELEQVERATTSQHSLPVSETFVSVQGEGRLTGVPSFFVRASGCNLRCAWCDTPYASWSPEGETRSVESIVEEAGTRAVRHAVLTGGEPMIFDAIEPLSHELRARGLHVTVETAGTVFRAPDTLACDLMSVSPKLSNSTPSVEDPRDPNGVWRERHEARRIDLGALQGLIDAYPNRQLKFVVASPADLGEIEDLLARLRAFAPEDVMLMPEGVTIPSPERVAWVVEACVERGWRYCQRLHIELFGNQRGT
jgi:7-carboxy-7-deazaguanine synthase